MIARAASPVPRTATPEPAATDTTQEDNNLKQAAAIITDITTLKQKLEWLWEQQIQLLLPDMFSDGSSLKGTSHAELSNVTIKLKQSLQILLLGHLLYRPH